MSLLVTITVEKMRAHGSANIMQGVGQDVKHVCEKKESK